MAAAEMIALIEVSTTAQIGIVDKCVHDVPLRKAGQHPGSERGQIDRHERRKPEHAEHDENDDRAAT